MSNISNANALLPTHTSSKLTIWAEVKFEGYDDFDTDLVDTGLKSSSHSDAVIRRAVVRATRSINHKARNIRVMGWEVR